MIGSQPTLGNNFLCEKKNHFPLISYDLNGCDRAKYRAYHKYAEIVLMRNNKQSPCLEYKIH